MKTFTCFIVLLSLPTTLWAQTERGDMPFSTNAFLENMAILRANAAPGEDAGALELARGANAQFAGQVNMEPLTEAAAAPEGRLILPETLELEANGAVGRFGPHFVRFAADASVPGAIDLITPDGVRLRSTVLGLAYFDAATGKSTLIAELNPTVGELVAPDRVLYRNAFNGANADILYTYARNSLQQDIIVRKQLPSPKEWGFSPATTRLEVWTECFDPPPPRRQANVIDLREHNLALGVSGEESLLDETLYFGSMRMVAGKAFTLGDMDNAVPVSKAWVQLSRRHFLVESSPYALLESQLDALPVAAVVPNEQKRGAVERADLRLPARKAAAASSEPMLAARTSAESEPGVVLDYIIVNSSVLNINFGDYSSNRVGMAAIGVSSNDFWNGYRFPGQGGTVTVTNLYWSDQSTSTVTLIVTNAPHILTNGVNDGMYNRFIYAASNTILVTLTNLPADTYHLYLYGHGISSSYNGIYRVWGGQTDYGTNHTSVAGTGWNSTDWDEGQQYVVFRNVVIQTNETIRIRIYPSEWYYPLIGGLQLVPADALPTEMLVISNLLNVDFGGTDTNKVGFAAVGLTTNDFWNGAYFPWIETPVSLTNLCWSTGSNSAVGMTVSTAPGVWNNGVNDGMYGSFIYPWYGGNITIAATNLPAGSYNLYLYGHAGADSNNGIYEVWSGELACGIKATTTGSG